MKRYIHKVSAALLLLSALVFCAIASAAPPPGAGGVGGGRGSDGGGGSKQPTGETASNHISFPVIFSDGVGLNGESSPSTDPVDPVFVTVSCDAGDPPACFTEVVSGTKVPCVTETDIIPPEKIPPEVLCYYGRQNLGISEETGEHVWAGDPRVWWLQQRPANNWQAIALSVDALDGLGKVVVTGVDTGDLLESSTSIKNKQIRTEFAMYLDADGYTDNNTVEFYEADARFSPYVGTFGADGRAVLDATMFQAFGMSGAVPGTDQSIAETQGTDYGIGSLGTLTVVDPTTIKVANNYFDPGATAPVGDVGIEAEEPGDPRIVALDPPIGMHAMIYSACARLMIQKVIGTDISWSSQDARWVGNGVNEPIVNVAAYNTVTDVYSAEVNAGGGIIYGYNWNTKTYTDGPGTYRLTFVLDGPQSSGGRCTQPLNTVFDETTMSINVGERKPATLVPGTDLMFTAGEGGLVYVDVLVGTGGGGGNKR